MWELSRGWSGSLPISYIAGAAVVVECVAHTKLSIGVSKGTVATVIGIGRSSLGDGVWVHGSKSWVAPRGWVVV